MLGKITTPWANSKNTLANFWAEGRKFFNLSLHNFLIFGRTPQKFGLFNDRTGLNDFFTARAKKFVRLQVSLIPLTLLAYEHSKPKTLQFVTITNVFWGIGPKVENLL